MELLERIKAFIFGYVSIVFKKLYQNKKLENKVVFTAYSGLKYADNPRAISEKLHELYPEIRQVWLMKRNIPVNIPDYVEVKIYGSLGMFRELMTAKIWVDNGTKSLWIRKREGQYFIQTWHGGLGFKKIGSDAKSNYTELDRQRDAHSFAMTDILLSNSKWLTNIFRRIFPYHGEIWECGSPKDDVFFNKTVVSSCYEEVRKEFKLAENTKIFLYAPTFRRKKDPKYFQLNFEELVRQLERKTNHKWVVFVKLHHWSEEIADEVCNYSSDVINATHYPNMQKITMAADMFMTDYSSGIFDFALLKRPGFLFAKDLEEYSKQERGLYVDLKHMPFPFADSEEKLFENIEHFDRKKYEVDLNQYFKDTGLVLSDHCSKDVCNKIAEYIKEK